MRRFVRLRVVGACSAALGAFKYHHAAAEPAQLNRSRIVLFTDLDGTLCGDSEKLREWQKFWDTYEQGSVLC